MMHDRQHDQDQDQDQQRDELHLEALTRWHAIPVERRDFLYRSEFVRDWIARREQRPEDRREDDQWTR